MGEHCEICDAILHDGKIEAVRRGGISLCKPCVDAMTTEAWLKMLDRVELLASSRMLREMEWDIRGRVKEIEEALQDEAK